MARELSADFGALEPLQTGNSVQRQIEELRTILEARAEIPVTLVGHSWGAWLVYMLASTYPQLVAKLVLVACGPMEEPYAFKILDTRLARLDPAERKDVQSLILRINDPEVDEKNPLLARLGRWFTRTDTFDPLPLDSGTIDVNFHIHRQVWSEAARMRRNGKLLELGKNITCPVTAIHGDYDPHPFQGVEQPLSRVLKSFRFYLLGNCGHYPWMERQARDEFFHILKTEI